MKRFNKTAVMMMLGGMSVTQVLAGEAATNATATNGVGINGSAAASANYNGLGGQGFARTRTDTAGQVNIGRGLAVGFDRDGLDVSFSHALAPKLGPAYAGTFNLSIGRDGQVNTSYGGVLSQGGLVRTAQAGGATSSNPLGGTAQATATGHAAPGGRVDAQTHSTATRRPISYSRGLLGGRR